MQGVCNIMGGGSSKPPRVLSAPELYNGREVPPIDDCSALSTFVETVGSAVDTKATRMQPPSFQNWQDQPLGFFLLQFVRALARVQVNEVNLQTRADALKRCLMDFNKFTPRKHDIHVNSLIFTTFYATTKYTGSLTELSCISNFIRCVLFFVMVPIAGADFPRLTASSVRPTTAN